MTGKRGPIIDRLMAKVEVDERGCWIFTGSHTPYGHGTISIGDGNRMRVAHRVAYEHFVGPVPEGLVLDHLCRVPACVNPEHVEPVTQRENLLRGATVTAMNAAKTHCVNGHELTPENCYARRPGWRECRTCMRERDRLRRPRQRKAA